MKIFTGKNRTAARLLSLMIVLLMALGAAAVPMPVSAATDIVYITNGGRELYFPGSTFMMKGQVANEGVGIDGVSVLVQAEIDGASPFFTGAPKTDANGFFVTGFNIPESAAVGSEMTILINGKANKSFEIKDMSSAVASENNIALVLQGFTKDSVGSVGSVGSSTVSSSLSAFGLVFNRNVNYFVNNSVPSQFIDENILGKNYRNEDCFTLYEGETGSKTVACSVSLMGEGGEGTVQFTDTNGAAGTTTERCIIYVKPGEALKADTVYRLVIDRMVTGNNNVHLSDDITVYYKTAASSESSGGAAGGGGGGAAGGGAGGGATEPTTPVTPGTENNGAQTGTSFSDVSADKWYADAVSYVTGKKLFEGMGGGKFAPDGSMNRAMFAVVMGRASGEDVSGHPNVFSDVETGSWYCDSVAWGYAKKLLSGVGAGSFAPKASVTREQIAVLLYNYEVYKNGHPTFVSGSYASMKDAARVSPWAETAVSWAYDKGIIKGDSAGNLNPQKNATRAEVAAMLQRAGM